MSKKIKLQDLSIVNFDQKLDMPDISGGFCVIVTRYRWGYNGSYMGWIPYRVMKCV